MSDERRACASKSGVRSLLPGLHPLPDERNPAVGPGPSATARCASDEVDFDSLAERHARLFVFVRRLATEQEELLSFERAVDRAMRALQLVKQLEADREAQEQRAFDEQVSRFLRVRTFMKKLGTASAPE